MSIACEVWMLGFIMFLACYCEYLFRIPCDLVVVILIVFATQMLSMCPTSSSVPLTINVLPNEHYVSGMESSYSKDLSDMS